MASKEFNVPATEESVCRYLTHPKGGDLKEHQAFALMIRHANVLLNGMQDRTSASHVGDELLRIDGQRGKHDYQRRER